MEAVGFSWLQEIFYSTKQPADVSEAIKGTNVHQFVNHANVTSKYNYSLQFSSLILSDAWKVFISFLISEYIMALSTEMMSLV